MKNKNNTTNNRNFLFNVCMTEDKERFNNERI